MNTLDTITYMKDFISAPLADYFFNVLSNELDWIRYETTPRMEYYINSVGTPYTYGKYPKTYLPRPDHPAVKAIKDAVENCTGSTFEVCFLNRYLNQSEHLGWHADDSFEMDDNRPIAIISLGVEREIWFREKGGKDITKLVLANGSMCLMAPGMQDTHEHRIPKAGFTCGERISLTFRGYTP